MQHKRYFGRHQLSVYIRLWLSMFSQTSKQEIGGLAQANLHRRVRRIGILALKHNILY